MRRALLTLLLVLLGAGVAQQEPWYAVPPFLEDLRPPLNVSEDMLAFLGPTAYAMHNLMTDGEKWAACTPSTEHIAFERYGIDAVMAWQHFGCRDWRESALGTN